MTSLLSIQQINSVQNNPGWARILENQILREQDILYEVQQEKALNEPSVVIETTQNQGGVGDKAKQQSQEQNGKRAAAKKNNSDTKELWTKTFLADCYTEIFSRDTYIAVTAECIAQLFLTYMIVQVNRTTSSYMTNKLATQLVIALGHTLTFGITFNIFFPISGCQMNAAVTIGLFAMGKLTFIRSLFTIFFQFVGAIVGAGLALWSDPKYVQLNGELNGSNYPQTNYHQVFAAEFAGMWIFMMSIIANAVDSRGMNYKAGAWQIGVALGYNIFLVGPASTGSLNPFRTLAPAIISTSYAFTWCFILGQLCGSLLAVAFYRNLFLDTEQKKGSQAIFFKQELHNKKVGQMLTYFKEATLIPSGFQPIYRLACSDYFMGKQRLENHGPFELNNDKLYIVEFFTANLHSMGFTCRVLSQMLKEFNGQGYSLETSETDHYPLQVIGITYDRPKHIRRWIEQNNPQYLIARDEGGRQTQPFLSFLDIKYLPTSIVIKNRNVIWVGNSANPQLNDIVRVYLNSNHNGMTQQFD